MTDINISSRAIEKLLDFVASGIGAIAGPLLAPWRESRDGKGRVIAARADAEVRGIVADAEGDSLQTIARAQAEARAFVLPPDKEVYGSIQIGPNHIQQFVEFQGKKRLSNLKSIVDYAAESLGEKEVPDHDPDPDWTARFFDSAQDVSSEYLQQLWAKILAGEVETPGRTSLRTLSILKEMSQREATQFSELMRFRINNFIFRDGCKAVTGGKLDTAMVHLAHVGLLYSGIGVGPVMKLEHDGIYNVLHNGHILIVEGSPESNVRLSSATIPLTSSGNELASLCQHKPNLDYLAHFARFLGNQNYVLKLARVLEMDSEHAGYVRTLEPHVIEPAVEGARVAN